ncbi:MAG: hypothetical protein AVDCRST_MAG20-1136, partial [uncultured Acidimicrobiales bacterium]
CVPTDSRSPSRRLPGRSMRVTSAAWVASPACAGSSTSATTRCWPSPRCGERSRASRTS